MLDKSLQGTETEKNLRDAFIAEATSLVKYYLFSKVTDIQYIKENLQKIAGNEKEHAEVFLDLLGGINNDAENLKNSIALEGFVSTVEYPDAARVAYEEGFPEIAKKFEEISTIEERHKRIFETLYQRVVSDTILRSPKQEKWICLKCGYIAEGLNPPEKCPVCDHSWEHFELF